MIQWLFYPIGIVKSIARLLELLGVQQVWAGTR